MEMITEPPAALSRLATLLRLASRQVYARTHAGADLMAWERQALESRAYFEEMARLLWGAGVRMQEEARS